MVYHPLAESHDDVLFTCEKHGIKMQPMRQMRRKFKWMEPKYGRDVLPWVIEIELDNNNSKYRISLTSADNWNS